MVLCCSDLTTVPLTANACYQGDSWYTYASYDEIKKDLASDRSKKHSSVLCTFNKAAPWERAQMKDLH